MKKKVGPQQHWMIGRNSHRVYVELKLMTSYHGPAPCCFSLTCCGFCTSTSSWLEMLPHTIWHIVFSKTVWQDWGAVEPPVEEPRKSSSWISIENPAQFSTTRSIFLIKCSAQCLAELFYLAKYFVKYPAAFFSTKGGEAMFPSLTISSACRTSLNPAWILLNQWWYKAWHSSWQRWPEGFGVWSWFYYCVCNLGQTFSLQFLAT